MRKLLWIPTILVGLVTAYGVLDLISAPDAGKLITALLLLAVTLLLARAARGKRKGKAPAPAKGKEQKTQPVATPAVSAAVPSPSVAPSVKPAAHEKRVVYTGKVKGTSYRQAALKRFYRLQENFDPIGYTLEQDTYQGKPSIKVMAEDISKDKPAVQIGFIAAADVDMVLPLIDHVSVDCEIYGGPEYDGDDKYFGAEVTLYSRK